MNERWVKYLYEVVKQVYADVVVALEDKNLSPRALYKLNKIRLGTRSAIHQYQTLVDPENESDQENENGTND